MQNQEESRKLPISLTKQKGIPEVFHDLLICQARPCFVQLSPHMESGLLALSLSSKKRDGLDKAAPLAQLSRRGFSLTWNDTGSLEQ